MLLRSPLRWHTFRVMILTSLVWVIFGMCILVYYMECLAGNGVNCRGKGLLNAEGPAPLVSLEENPSHTRLDIHSEDDWPHLRLAPYQESHLHTWVAPSKWSHPLYLHCWPIVCFVSQFYAQIPHRGLVRMEKEWISPRNRKRRKSKSSNWTNLICWLVTWLHWTGPFLMFGSMGECHLYSAHVCALSVLSYFVVLCSNSCRRKRYPKYLPNTSIVIVFHNEAWSTLLRTGTCFHIPWFALSIINLTHFSFSSQYNSDFAQKFN